MPRGFYARTVEDALAAHTHELELRARLVALRGGQALVDAVALRHGLALLALGHLELGLPLDALEQQVAVVQTRQQLAASDHVAGARARGQFRAPIALQGVGAR